MTHIIYNIAIILIIAGMISLTYTLTLRYNKCPKQIINQNTKDQERPSKLYNTMFTQSDIWMGYADFDTKKYKSKLM